MFAEATVAGVWETFCIVLGCVVICGIAQLVQYVKGRKGK